MAQVIWRRTAIEDLRRLFYFLYEKDQSAANKAASAIKQGALRFETTPRIGCPIPDKTNRRELFIPFGARFYVIRYFLESSETVIIVRIWHSREDRVD